MCARWTSAGEEVVVRVLRCKGFKIGIGMVKISNMSFFRATGDITHHRVIRPQL